MFLQWITCSTQINVLKNESLSSLLFFVCANDADWWHEIHVKITWFFVCCSWYVAWYELIIWADFPLKMHSSGARTIVEWSHTFQCSVSITLMFNMSGFHVLTWAHRWMTGYDILCTLFCSSDYCNLEQTYWNVLFCYSSSTHLL